MLIRKLLLPILVLGTFANASYAADRYVRAGANGNGSDWANAYPSLPATLVRGDTYYIADGSYPSHTFKDSQSGSTPITIKKATVSNHGTSIGWDNSYGDGQAVFNATLRFETGNYVLDGQTRNEADWFAGTFYGIKIAHNGQDQNIVIAGGSASSNIAIKYVFVDAIEGNLPTDRTIRRYAIDTDTYGGSIATGLLFHRMYVHGSNNVWFLRTTNGAVVEYSAAKDAVGNGANHAEAVNLFYSGNNAIVRYNKFKDMYVAGGATAIVAITYADGLQFYGNVVSNFSDGDGAIGFDGYYSSHNRVYNNTFIDGTGACGTAWGSGTDNLVYNNLFINCRTVGLAGTHDYNGFSDSNSRGEAHPQVNLATSIFANYAGGDFRLTSNTSPGMFLGTPFNLDMSDKVRGADGVWDRGAFEYSAGAPPTTTAPTTTSSTVPSTTSTTARATTTTTTTTSTIIVTPPANGQSVFSTQVPQTLSNSDGAGVNYELGLRFTPTTAGQIRSIRFYKSASESGSHTGKIYAANGQLLASVVFSNESGSDWQVQNLATPLNVIANTEYTVSVNTGNSFYVATNNGLSSGITSGSLQSPTGGGVYGPVGSKPNLIWQNSNYFRDVVFVPNPTGQSLFTTQTPQLLSNTDGANVNYELGMRFTTTTAGQIKAIRFYKSSSESGVHSGKIYAASGQLLALVNFTSETGLGWQVQNLPAPLNIAANTEYTVTVNTGNSYYVTTNNGLVTQITNGSLRSVGGGVFGPVGAKPTQTWQSSNYFRDVVFAPFSN
jgi:hypothetical protein